MELHLIYTETNVVLSKKRYEDWTQIQEEYSDYKASLGPWSLEEMIDFLNEEYSNLLPTAVIQVNKFYNGRDITKELSWS
tara:strand:+ start:408 stop:647 length:240 start_codon:yes stop_codon:yes gene_type:complete